MVTPPTTVTWTLAHGSLEKSTPICVSCHQLFAPKELVSTMYQLGYYDAATGRWLHILCPLPEVADE